VEIMKMVRYISASSLGISLAKRNGHFNILLNSDPRYPQ